MPNSNTSSDRKFAEGTKVSVEKTLTEIKRHLMRYGATSFMQGEDPERVALMFIINYRQENEFRIRFTMKAPNFDDFLLTPQQKKRTPAQQQTAYEAERMRAWRALGAAIKGKLIAVDENIESIEEAFWGQTLTPSGRTVYEETRGALIEANKRGLMPAVPLLALPEKKD